MNEVPEITTKQRDAFQSLQLELFSNRRNARLLLQDLAGSWGTLLIKDTWLTAFPLGTYLRCAKVVFLKGLAASDDSPVEELGALYGQYRGVAGPAVTQINHISGKVFNLNPKNGIANAIMG